MGRIINNKFSLYACLAAIIIASLIPIRVFALDSRFYSLNDILFYDPNATGCAPSSVPGSNIVQKGVDTSGRPNYEQVKAAGYNFVGRYLEITKSGTGAPFNGQKPDFLTTDELNSAKQAGVGVFLIFEWNMGPPNPTPNDSQTYPNSFDHGARDAQIALKALSNLGLPATTPVYYSLDRGYNPNSSNPTYYATFDQEIDYFKGIDSIINNTSAVGAYAPQAELQSLKQQNLIGWQWQAWWKDHTPHGWGEHMWQLTHDSSNPLSVGGVGVDEDFAYSDNIGQIGYTGGSGSASSSSTDVKQREETILKYFTGKGLSLAAAAGITGNFKRESDGTYDPHIMYGGKMATSESDATSAVSFGIAQWEGTRTTGLINYAHSVGGSIFDLNVQLDYSWIKEANSGSYKTMMTDLNSTKSDVPYNGIDSALAAAIIWHGVPKSMLGTNRYVDAVGEVYGFERSADTADAVVNGRGAYAQQIYTAYKGQIADGTGVAGAGTASTGTTGSDCNSLPGALSGSAAQKIVTDALQFAWDYYVGPNDGKNQVSDAKPEFVAALESTGNGLGLVADCAGFVSTVMKASGVDPGYNASTGWQVTYVLSHPEKYQVIRQPQLSDLRPGDILLINTTVENIPGEYHHHTMIYVGDSSPVPKYPIRNAWQDQKVPTSEDAAYLTSTLTHNGELLVRALK